MNELGKSEVINGKGFIGGSSDSGIEERSSAYLAAMVPSRSLAFFTAWKTSDEVPSYTEVHLLQFTTVMKGRIIRMNEMCFSALFESLK